jgi:hypothetical protein
MIQPSPENTRSNDACVTSYRAISQSLANETLISVADHKQEGTSHEQKTKKNCCQVARNHRWKIGIGVSTVVVTTLVGFKGLRGVPFIGKPIDEAIGDQWLYGEKQALGFGLAPVFGSAFTAVRIGFFSCLRRGFSSCRSRCKNHDNDQDIGYDVAEDSQGAIQKLEQSYS